MTTVILQNFIIAFNAIWMLVCEEHISQETKRELDISRAAEARWRERAAALEGELATCKSQSRYVA